MKRLAGVLLLVAALLSACGEDTGGVIEQDDQTTGDEQSTAEFNDADVTFAQMMIPHHRQAVEMAELVPDRAESEEVKALAERIKEAQAPEIEMMTSWLEEWDQPLEAEMGGMDMGEGGQMDGMEGMEGMEGMLSEEQMASLEEASGAQFDELFLTSMREHHVGAVEMAEEELRAGQSPEAIELAQTIIDTQQAEIEEIDQLLAG